MANILYGVAGEGSGHSSRAKEIIEYLQSKGHKIKVISYDRGYKNLSPFFDVEEIFGLKFTLENNEVQYIKTLVDNLLKTPEAAASIERVSKMIDDSEIQIVFSDFEPISCIAANIKKIPLISIDNQHRLTNTKFEYPRRYEQEALAAKAVVNLMIFNSRACLVTTFHKAEVTNPKTFLFPPILRKDILGAKPQSQDYILVYLSFQFKNVVDILKNIKAKFVVYGIDRDDTEDNIVFKKASQKGFLEDLINCKAVIATAGFTLMTEALYLDKPYLALPVKKQFEQIVNAYYLDKLGYGKYWEEIDKGKVELFLSNLDEYRKNLAGYQREDNSRIFRKIDQLIEKEI